MLKPFYHKKNCLSSLLAPCCAPFFVKRKPLAFFFSSFAGKLTSWVSRRRRRDAPHRAKSLLLSIEKQKRTSLKNIQPLLGNRQRANYEKPRKQFRIFQRETIKIWHKLWHTFYETLCHIVQNITIKQGKTAQNGRFCPMAEKQGFEPWLRFSRTTPLAGEPLRPLGYFSLNRKRITKDA